MLVWISYTELSKQQQKKTHQVCLSDYLKLSSYLILYGFLFRPLSPICNTICCYYYSWSSKYQITTAFLLLPPFQPRHSELTEDVLAQNKMRCSFYKQMLKFAEDQKCHRINWEERKKTQ